MNKRSGSHHRQQRFEQVPLETIAVCSERAIPTVLSVTGDHALGQARSEMLERAGLHVETVANAEEASRLLLNKRYDAVVVGHSLPKAGKAEVIGAARAAKSAPWVIGLYDLWSGQASGVHLAVDMRDGAEALVSAIRRLAFGRAGEISSQSSQHR